MKMLIAGLLVFTLVHTIPAGATELRGRLIAAMGENPYKGVFALLILASIVMMVFGWKATQADEVYVAADWGWIIALPLVLGACVLFFAPYVANNIKRSIRHPQLVGIVLLGLGHVAAVGNVRSIVLFAGLALWAVTEILLLNRRDGPAEKPEPVPAAADGKLALGGLIFFLILLVAHNGLFGVTPLPS